MNTKRNASNVWAYVIAGSAVGGAVGYLFMTESGRKIRRTVTHPDELASNVEQAGAFLQQKARLVTEQIHGVISKTKFSMDEGERAYRDAGEHYRAQFRRVETKNGEIAASVHNAVDRMSQAAVGLEQSVLEPMIEIGALYRGVEKGIRTLLGTTSAAEHNGPIPIHRNRVIG
jgi:hypothetical protein